MRIIVDSIKDHLISQVSSKKTPKQNGDAFSKMYEGKNINKKMNLSTQLKGDKMRKGEFVQDYVTRISRIKEKLSVIGDTLDEDELVMTTPNGFTRTWDSFIQTLCARKVSMMFDIIWEDCIQEEAKVPNRESLLREYD